MAGFVDLIAANKGWLVPSVVAVVIAVIGWFFIHKPQESRGTDLAVKALTKRLDEKSDELAERNLEIRQLKEAATAVSEQKGPGVAEALAELEKGETAKAEKLFEKIIKSKRQEGDAALKEAAAAARHLGALAFLHDTEKALRAYRQAVDLDPDDPDGWNLLGRLLLRNGALDDATRAFEKVLTLGNRARDKSVIAAATGNLGNIYLTRDDPDKAEEHYKKALVIHEELGSKEGMASAYGNLGNIYQKRGDLGKAEEYHRKALALHDELNSKDGMAADYGNLGVIYGMRGDPDKAEEHFRKALALNEELGSKEGMASNYGNLGTLALQRSDKDQACEHYAKALALFRDIGMALYIRKTIEIMEKAGCPPPE